MNKKKLQYGIMFEGKLQLKYKTSNGVYITPLETMVKKHSKKDRSEIKGFKGRITVFDEIHDVNDLYVKH